MQEILTYLAEIQKELQTGAAKEHSYRPAFKKLIESISQQITAINEPSYTGGNAPDFLFKKGATPIAYAECKDINIDIEDKTVQKQALRYVDAFGKILLTNYIDFEFVSESGDIQKISIARISENTVVVQEENLEQFTNLLKNYLQPGPRTIRSAKSLAKIMANKARLLRDASTAALEQNVDSDISQQYAAFREVLIRDLSEKEFADMYAQTLVYGLFVARYFDTSLEDFSRHEAQDLLPSTNPLLKKFFAHVAGVSFDPKIAWIVDDLIEAYKSADVKQLMHKEFEKKKKDPVLHFYETFLSEYDQKLRKSRGVYYTPEPVVSFIVRSVDQILKSKFSLTKGLADTSKVSHEFKIPQADGRTKDGVKKVTEDIHKVQILDPAVGTGTFLNEVIHEIYKTFKGQEGLWQSYAGEHLLPRLHGFELMMASYTMAHLKLGVTLKELGYDGSERLSVWLTNSLEEGVHEVPNLFMSQWLTQESNEASRIKSEMPIMVVLGNPPYSVSSANKGEQIQNLIADYKKDLNERKINLDDDYIKFIRYAEDQVEKTGYGIIAMITNNSFIDGVTHRQMRKHLMESFDEIYVLDLHGNSKKKETTPDGGKDENVFSIQQGVSINLFVKTGERKNLADVYHAELFGRQSDKYQMLNENSFDTLDWQELDTTEPYYFFTPKDFEAEEKYKLGFKIDNLMSVYNSGIQTKRDKFTIHYTVKELEGVLNDLQNLETEAIRSKYQLPKDGRDWTVEWAKRDVLQDFKVVDILYRPFDVRKTAYTNRSKGFLAYPRQKTSEHFIDKENLGLLTVRQQSTFPFQHVLVSNKIVESGTISLQTKEWGYQFPLYLYHEDGSKVPNLDKETWDEINKVAGETQPEDILDYIYAVLHSPAYREKYKEFLKIDFPLVPYPENKDTFWELVELGQELRHIHLLESPVVENYITVFPEVGSNIVEKGYPKFRKEGSVSVNGVKMNGGYGYIHINKEQYFGGVPEIAWEFYIGGYRPAYKWLKDRRGRELTSDDIQHYQKIIVALTETDRIMKEIDKTWQP